MSQQSEDKSVVLIVDDDRALRSQLRWTLDDFHKVLEAETRAEALEKMNSERVDVVLCDLHMPPDLKDISEGLAVLEAARAMRPSVPVVVITASENKRAALEAVRRGAYGFFEKPFDAEEVSHIVAQAARVRSLEEEVLRLRSELDMFRGFGRFVGKAEALQRVLKQARTVADTNATVLITGENGTGKEVLARAIHEEGARASHPFIAVSCAALPETLIESELFGHERGAFTGAHAARKGRFELADGGTLFLDEIGELNAAMQVKLLRVLQERAFERLGGSKTIEVDIHLIAASNRNLEEDVEAGRFRRDLFYRLNVIPLHLPPLRERRDDIPLLAAHFATKAAAKYNRPPAEMDPALLEALNEYDWPGNIRELENLIERLVVLTTSGRLSLEFLPEKMNRAAAASSDELAGPSGQTDETTFEGAVCSFKRRLIREAIASAGGNKAAAAKRLRMSRSYLHRLISELNVNGY